MRMHVDRMGFFNQNRGGMGVVPYHDHEVAEDFVKHKISQIRYGSIRVVKLPESELPFFRAYNKKNARKML